jgi:hypothetical protein
MIPEDEIRILTEKCERFQIDFLNEKGEKPGEGQNGENAEDPEGV